MDLEEGEIIISDISSDDEIHPQALSKGNRDIHRRKSNPSRPDIDETTSNPVTRHKKKSFGPRNYYMMDEVRKSAKDKSIHYNYNRKVVEGRKKGIGSPDHNMRRTVAEKTLRVSLPSSKVHKAGSVLDSSHKMPKKRKQKKRSSHTVKVLSNDLCCKKRGVNRNSLYKTIVQSEGSSASGSLNNYSLMNKLITAGLAKYLPPTKPSLVEIASSSSNPELNISCNKNRLSVDEVPSLIEQETTISNSNEVITNEDEEDSEIEVIIPPKKIPPLVTLDSDGEEVDATNLNESVTKEHSLNQLESTEALLTKTEKCEESIVTEFSDSSSVKCMGSEEDLEPYSPTSPSTCSNGEKTQCPFVFSNFRHESQSHGANAITEDSDSSHSSIKSIDSIENQTPHIVYNPSIDQHFDECMQVNSSSNKECAFKKEERNSTEEQDNILGSFTSHDQNNTQTNEVYTMKILSPKTIRNDEYFSDCSQEVEEDKEPYSPSSFYDVILDEKQTHSHIANSNDHSECLSKNLETSPSIQSKDTCSMYISTANFETNNKNATNFKLDCDDLVSNLDDSLSITGIMPVVSPRTKTNNQNQVETINRDNCSTDNAQKEKSSVGQSAELILPENNNIKCYDKHSNIGINKNLSGSDDEDDLSQLRLIALSSKGKTNQNLTQNMEENNIKRPVNTSKSNTSADDEEDDILQLRVAALKSAVIKKHEARKKRGLKVKKRHRENSEDLLPFSSALESSLSQNKTVQSNASIPESKNDSPLSTTEITDSLQGEEDMEIASDSGGDIIQDGNIQEKSLLLNQTCEPFKSTKTNSTNATCLPNSNVVSGNISTNYSVIPVQPLPPGVDSDFTVDCSNQPFVSVLPPPPPPPTTLMFSLTAPPPPPPPYSPSTITNIQSVQPSQEYSTSEFQDSFDQYTYSTPSYFAKSQYATVEDIVYKGKPSFSSMDVETTDNVSNNGISLSDVNKVDNDLLSKPQFNTNQIGRCIQMRPNLKPIPMLRNIPKLTKKKLKKMQKFKVKIQPSLHQEPKLLCITNTPNFRKSKSKINLSLQTPQKRSSVLCSTDLLTSRHIKQRSLIPTNIPVSLCNEIAYSTGNKDITHSKYSSPVQEHGMDLSEMIVLDEVGMSPEYKSSDDASINCSFKNDEEDESALRACALTSLSNNAISNITAFSSTSKMFNTFTSKSVEINDGIGSEFKSSIKTRVGNKNREWENILVTRRGDRNDSSKYKLTRVVRKEPQKRIVHGRESLKVVIPSVSPPIVSHSSPPVVDRLVINVGQDSDTDEDSQWMRKVRIEDNEQHFPTEPVVDHELERSIDLLLLNARQTIENSESIPVKKKKGNLPTPKNKQYTKTHADTLETPLRLLPKEKQEEYYRLNKIIEEKEREIKNQTRLFKQKQKEYVTQQNRSVGVCLQEEMPKQEHVIPAQNLAKNQATCSQSVDKTSASVKRIHKPNQQNSQNCSKESINGKSDSRIIDLGETFCSENQVSNQMQEVNSKTTADIVVHTKASYLNRKKDRDVSNEQETERVGCIASKSHDQEVTLTSNKAQLLNERFTLIDDLSKMSESLNELDREQESVNKEMQRINELRKALLSAEEKLVSQTSVTQKLELKLFEAHQSVYKRYTQIQQLEASSRELGTCLHGSEYKIPAFGVELMWNKIKQVSDKRDDVIAKREVIRTLMKNPGITKEEMSNVVTRRNNVGQDSGADKYSLLHIPNESLFSPLPIEKFIGHNRELQSPHTPHPCKFQCEDSVLTNLPVEGSHYQNTANQIGHSKSTDPIFKTSNNLATSENIEIQPPTSVSSKIAQHASSEVPENCSSSQSRTTHLLSSGPSSFTEAIKTQGSQLLELTSGSEATITGISNSFKTLTRNLNVLSESVYDKRKFTEVDGSVSGPNNKRINPSVTNTQISDINVTTGKSSSKPDNEIAKCETYVSVSRPIKSHLKYKSVLQYKKPISSIPASKAAGEIVCRYEILGKCQDKQCKYKHFSPRS